MPRKNPRFNVQMSKRYNEFPKNILIYKLLYVYTESLNLKGVYQGTGA